MVNLFEPTAGNGGIPITVIGKHVRAIRWYNIQVGTFNSYATFVSASSGSVGSTSASTKLTESDVYSQGHALWTGDYSGGDLVITTNGRLGYSFVDVDYDEITPSPTGYNSSLKYEMTIHYSPTSNNQLTYNYGQFSQAALQQAGFNYTQFDQYAITPQRINYLPSGSTSGLVSSTSNTDGKNLKVNLQTATPMLGQVKLQVEGIYKNAPSQSVTIDVTINCVPDLTTPLITFPDQTKKYAGSPVSFTLSPSSASSGAFDYTFGSGLTKTSTNTCTAANVGSYTVNVSQKASGWYNAAYSSATLTVTPADLSLAAKNYTTYPDEYFNIASKLITSCNNKTTPTFYYRKTGTSTWTKITGSTWPLTPDRTTYDVQICYDADNTNKVAAKPYSASAAKDATVTVIWRPFDPVYKDYTTRVGSTFDLKTTCFDHNNKYTNTKTPSFRYRKVGATSYSYASGTTWPGVAEKGNYYVWVSYPEDGTNYVLGKSYETTPSKGYDFMIHVYEETAVPKNTVEILRGSSYSLPTLIQSTNNTKAATKYYYRKNVGGTWAEHSGSTFQTTSTTPTGSYTFQAVYPSDETNFIAQKDFVNNNSTYDGVIGVFEPVVLTCKDAEKYTDESLNLTSYIRTVNNTTTPKFYYRKRGETTWSPLTDYTFSGKPVGIYEVFVEYPNRDRTNWIWDRKVATYGQCDFTVTVKQRSSVTANSINIVQGTTIDLKTLITSSVNKMEPEFYHCYADATSWTSLPYSTFATYSTTPKGTYRIQICYPYDEVNNIDAKPFNSTGNLDDNANAYVNVYEPVKLVANDHIAYNDADINLASYLEDTNNTTIAKYYYRKNGTTDWINSTTIPAASIESGWYDIQVVYENRDESNDVWTKLFDDDAVDFRITVNLETKVQLYYNLPLGHKQGFCYSASKCHYFLETKTPLTEPQTRSIINQNTLISPTAPLKKNPLAEKTYDYMTSNELEVVDANDRVFKVQLYINPPTYWIIPNGFTSTGGLAPDQYICNVELGPDTYTTSGRFNDDQPQNDTRHSFIYYTKGSKTANGSNAKLPTEGTYYKFTVAEDGMLTVYIFLNKRCKFYLLETSTDSGSIVSRTDLGSELETWNGAYGSITLPVQTDKEYYLFSTDEPLGFYGYHFYTNPHDFHSVEDGLVKENKME